MWKNLITKIHKSKTILFGWLVVFFGSLQTFLPTVQAFVDPLLFGKLTIGIGLVVLILRSFTSKPLEDK